MSILLIGAGLVGTLLFWQNTNKQPPRSLPISYADTSLLATAATSSSTMRPVPMSDPEPLGIVYVNEQQLALVGVRGRLPDTQGGFRTAYALVKFRNQDGRMIESGVFMTCDSKQRGLVFGVPMPDTPVVVTLGVSESGPVHMGSNFEVDASNSTMRAWADPGLRFEHGDEASLFDLELLHFGESEPSSFCS